jgi:PiT family inorganic phosphate transporter
LIWGTRLFSGLFLGWGIGANDSANIFGAAVATNSVRYKTATILIAIFVILGSVFEGAKLYHGYSFADTTTTMEMAFICTLGAALTVLTLTYFGLPGSTSQAAVGGVMGIAILSSGMGGANWEKLGEWACCWLLNPLGSAVVAFLCIRFVGPLIQRFVRNIGLLNMIYKTGLVVFGCYGAYSLGANNVVVTTGPFFQAGLFGDPSLHSVAVVAAAVGGVSIAIGALTYSKKVMMTVGKGITALDPFSALVAVLAHSLAMHFFTQLHVPVSSSQAIVGAVAGVGLSKGMRTVNSKMLWSIIIAWVLTPVAAAILSLLLALLFGVNT